MRESAPFNFGLTIAYLVPGFIALWGASYHSPTLRAWLAASPDGAPSIGGLLYTTLAALGTGVILSAFRWAIIEPIHHRSGLQEPDWDFSVLAERLPAYQAMVEQHFRYHQFCANMLVAIVFAYVARMAASGLSAYQWGWLDVGLPPVAIVLFLGSRDALAKYYRRAGALFHSPSSHQRRFAMNGGQKAHQPAPKSAEAKAAEAAKQGSVRQPKPASAAKPQAK